jgi:ectoine hydroxylase-related dioxygenase (phytanoyl-CoA dioxygenase family)
MATQHAETTSLERDGYVVLAAILDPAEVAAMLAAAGDMLAESRRDPTCRAGDALVFSGHLRHSGTRNRSESRRDSLQISFER